jgi:hypothetical protein
MTLRSSISIGLATLALAACTSGGNGSLTFFASGEEAAVTGYPAGDIAFVDGWTMTFDHVLVAVGSVMLDGEEVAGDQMIVDLHNGRTELFTEMGLAARRYEIGYSLVVPDPAAFAQGPVDAEAMARMRAAGASIYIEGTASHPTHGEYTFEIVLPRTVVASACEQADGTLGVVVPENGAAEGEITVHLDHLFFDSATDEEPRLRFEAWAAVAGADRRVTMDELATQELADLIGIDGEPLMDGGELVAYEPPATGLPAPNLRELVIAQAITVPHWTGEGHCSYE